MTKTQLHRQKKTHINVPSPGSSPGTVYIGANALDPIIVVHQYNALHYTAQQLNNLRELDALLKTSTDTFWVEIKGFNAVELFDTLNQDYQINKLVLEDITHTYQRPKYEEYGHYDFAVSRMLLIDAERSLENEQFSFVLMKNVLFTFQEKYDDCLHAVKKRLEIGKGNIRTSGSSYLMYALMDMITDEYFSILNTWSSDLDGIEDKLLAKPDKTVMLDTQHIKRNLITLRRIIWPERDKINDMLRTDSELVTEQAKVFLRDTYDHCVQLIDMTESLKEISASIIDMYLSLMSNRMNEIVKVLTIISSIFIPLTFIAGVYGMNFENMPELHQENGYVYTIAAMTLIALLQVIYFWRKGWFK